MLKSWLLAAMGVNVHDVNPRASSSCTDGTYTSLDGLTFQITCDSGVMSSNVQSSSTQDNLTACMEACSISRSLCYGVSFNTTNGNCTFKDEDYVPSGSSSTVHSAVAPLYEFQINDTDCGYSNYSVNKIVGADWLVTCYSDMSGDDYVFDGDWLHTDTFDDCIESCVTFHPICKAVSWEGDMGAGFGNCYRKYGNTTDGLELAISGPPTHTAQLVLPSLNITCSEGNATVGNDVFTVGCQKSNGGTVGTEVNALDLSSCMEACSAQSNCTGVNWGADYDDGYMNCYLLSKTDSVSQNTTYHTATLTARDVSTSSSSNGTSTDSGSSTSSSPTSTSTNGSSGSSKSLAWIAGPIVGALVAIGAAVGLFFFFRRKKEQQLANQPLPQQETQYYDQYPGHPSPQAELAQYNQHNDQTKYFYGHEASSPMTHRSELATDRVPPVELA